MRRREEEKREMESQGTGKREAGIQKIGYWCTTAVFTVFLALFTVGEMLHRERSFSPEENRYLAGKPGFTVQKLLDGSYGEEYENYLSDQFPLRTSLVAAKVNAERLMMRADVNGVYFGKDGYYIEKFEPEDLMTEQAEKNVEILAEAAGRFSKRLGNDHVRLLLVPSASQILSDKLPAFAAPGDQGELVRLLEEKAVCPDMVLPVEEILRAHRDEPVYYRTDHHWTTRGAFYGYQLYANSVGIAPQKESEFTQIVATDQFLGTIQAKINVSMKPDEIILYRPVRPEKYSVYYDGLPQEYGSLYHEEALSGRDAYAVFLDGNHGWTKIVNRAVRGEEGRAMEGRRLLILKDSYAHCFAPFVAAHFDEVHMVDLRYFNAKLSDFVRQQGITDVLFLYQIPGFAKETSIFKLLR